MKPGCTTTTMASRTYPTFSWKNFIFFQSLALFSRNSINTNKVEVNDSSLKTKQISAAMKLVHKFVKKVVEHADNNLVPKEIPPFAKSFFVEKSSGNITIAPSADLKTGVNQQRR
jgi:hypothetical protein